MIIRSGNLHYNIPSKRALISWLRKLYPQKSNTMSKRCRKTIVEMRRASRSCHTGISKRKKRRSLLVYQYSLVANAAIVGPMIIATTTSAAAFSKSPVMPKIDIPQFAIPSARTPKIIAMTMPTMLIKRSFPEEVARALLLTFPVDPKGEERQVRC